MQTLKRYSNVNKAKVIRVIEVRSLIGAGIKGDPIREVREYFNEEGELLARTKGLEDLQLGEWVDESAPKEQQEEDV